MMETKAKHFTTKLSKFLKYTKTVNSSIIEVSENCEVIQKANAMITSSAAHSKTNLKTECGTFSAFNQNIDVVRVICVTQENREPTPSRSPLFYNSVSNFIDYVGNNGVGFIEVTKGSDMSEAVKSVNSNATRKGVKIKTQSGRFISVKYSVKNVIKVIKVI